MARPYGSLRPSKNDGRRVAIRQIVVEPSGTVHRYWWEHLEDEGAFLTDQPVDYTDQLDAISADEFGHLWRTSLW